MAKQNKMGETYDIEEKLCFRCDKGVPCFNTCCQDVTIVLGPYDILRLRQALNLTTRELIEKHVTVLNADKLIPMLVLTMNEADEKRCHFVTPDGCSVYPFRPWACRMFPVDITEDGKAFRIIVDNQRCEGLKEDFVRPIREYLNEQGTPKYQVMDDMLGELINHESFRQLDVTNDQIRQMIFMALYDMDEFRKFVFESSFLKKFDIDERRITRLERDDEELLRLGFEWVEFGLLGRQVLKLKPELEKQRGDTK